MINPADLGDPLTFPLVPLRADICSFEWNFSETIEWIAIRFGKFGIFWWSLNFSLTPSSGQKF